MRVNVKRLQVPVLPLEDQKRYGEAFRRLAEFEAVLARASDEGRELARSLSDALSSGDAIARQAESAGQDIRPTSRNETERNLLLDAVHHLVEDAVS